jgi:serine/threonine-protein kinase HipA
VQFAAEARVATLRDPGAPEVQWLTDADVATRLRALREDETAWRSARDHGQFSLAGAQPKTALLHDGRRWGVPSGRTPTTHILKPPLAGRPGHVENEHVCLRLARAVGLPAARSEVRRFDGEIAIVVERFDRSRTVAPADAAGTARRRGRRRAAAPSGQLLRLHQEDLCQALGLSPGLKYQSQGGPSPADVVGLLREHSTHPEADVATFTGSLAFNWLIAGTAAKNYALLHGAGGRVRLAPLYDLASALPYPDLDGRRLRLAMRIGSAYRLDDVRRRNWIDLATTLRLESDEFLARIAEMARRLAAAIREVRDEEIAAGLDRTVVTRLAGLLEARVERCARALGADLR